MNRFFLPPSAIQNDTIVFPADTAHQILRVLRLHPGDSVIVLDDLGNQFRVDLDEVSSSKVTGRVVEKSGINTEPPITAHLYICLTQREKFEWILQKCTEVGVAEFTPILSNRSLVQDLTALENKYPRWQRILQEAAEQSGRGCIPRLQPPQNLIEAVQAGPRVHNRCLVAWEEETSRLLTRGLSGLTATNRIALLIGPEGGLTREEIDLARQAGWQSVSLGPRTLRMETAAVVAAALVISAFENRAD